jgi:hypothetical protein
LRIITTSPLVGCRQLLPKLIALLCEGRRNFLRRTLIVHAGLPKTGSSTIQRFLTDNRQGLAGLGIFLPRTGTGRHAHNHSNLVNAFGMPDGQSDVLSRLQSELASAGLPERC